MNLIQRALFDGFIAEVMPIVVRYLFAALEHEEPRNGQRRLGAPLPVETAEERGERLRARKIERAEEKSAAEKRLDEIFERVRAADLLRQKAKRARIAKR